MPDRCPRCHHPRPLHTLVDSDGAALCCGPCLVELLKASEEAKCPVALLVGRPIIGVAW